MRLIATTYLHRENVPRMWSSAEIRFLWTNGTKTELTGNGRQRSTYVCHVGSSYPFSPFAPVFSGVMSDLELSVAAKRIRRRQSVRCGHCDRLVPASTYYRHCEQFYDVSQQWQQHAEHAEHLSVQNSSHEQEDIRTRRR